MRNLENRIAIVTGNAIEMGKTTAKKNARNGVFLLEKY